MSRSELMARLLRMARLAQRCEQTGESTDDVLGAQSPDDAGRRRFTQGVLAATTTAAAWSLAPGALAKSTGGTKPVFTAPADVAVVGAGIAGLACATELARLGISAQVFEAGDRVGGRIASLRGVFPGQVVERGAEFIGSSHNVMLGYARQLGLELEDLGAAPGAAFHYFGGRRYTEAQVLEEFRGFTASIKGDLERISHPNADQFTPADAEFDFLTVDELLELRDAGGLLRQLVSSAVQAEFGAGTGQVSAISLLRFLHADQRGKQSALDGNGGRFLRVVDGNDRIPAGLAAQLPRPVALGHHLVAVRQLASGRYRLVFEVDGRSQFSEHDAVVLALPFTVLRHVELHASLQLPEWKRMAISTADMGSQNRLLVGFQGPYWYERHGLSGTGFSDRAAMPATWESNPGRSGAGHAVLAASLGPYAAGPGAAQVQAQTFVDALEAVAPGARSAAARDRRGNLLAHVEDWAGNPLSLGAQVYNRPGYFTTNAHHEAKPVGKLLFAGDHTSSFYEWQGFMEGAALSGLRAAAEVLSLSRA